MSAIIEMSNPNDDSRKNNIATTAAAATTGGYRLVPVSASAPAEPYIDVTPTPPAANAPANAHTLTFPVTGQNVRTVIIEGKVWLVARDVALVLGYTDVDQSIRKHCKHVKTLKAVELTGLTTSPRGINIIPESDVYRLVMRSKLPTAEAFQDWVVEEVLPSLRQHGGYMLSRPEESPEDIMARALIIAQTTITQQKAALEVAKPLVEAHQRMTQGGTHYPIREALRALRVPMRDVHRVCSADGILRRELVEGQYRWWPTRKAVEKGLVVKFRDVAGTWNYGFTAAGMAWLQDKLFIG